MLVYMKITPEQAIELTQELRLSGYDIGEDGRIAYPHKPVSGTCSFRNSRPGMGLYGSDWNTQRITSSSSMTVFEPSEISGSYIIPDNDFKSYLLLLEQSPYYRRIRRICESVLGHDAF